MRVFFLKFTFFTVCLFLYSYAGAYENKNLEFMDNVLKNSSSIAFHHIPNSAIGSRLKSKENILDDWKYKIILNCSETCYGRDTLLNDIFLNAVRQANDCPLPYNTLIKFLNGDREILLVFFHQSGHCFSINDESYFSERKFSPMIDFLNF